MLKALIFDMDGTLVHSDPVHLRAFASVLAPEGIMIDEAVYKNSIVGRTNEAIFASLLPHRSKAEHIDLADRKEAAFRAIASDLQPLAGLVDLLDKVIARGLRIGLVTNAPRLNAEHMLSALGIQKYFNAIVTIEDVARGKPDPLPYLTALDRLGIDADEAIVFEDSPSGIKAAKAAGIFSCGVLTAMTSGEMIALGADMAIADFQDTALRAFLDRRLATE